jgi:hypothetical protein
MADLLIKQQQQFAEPWGIMDLPTPPSDRHLCGQNQPGTNYFTKNYHLPIPGRAFMTHLGCVALRAPN